MAECRIFDISVKNRAFFFLHSKKKIWVNLLDVVIIFLEKMGDLIDFLNYEHSRKRSFDFL